MKRMNLIRAALFAVCAFMGTMSLSAQVVWKSPAQAKEIIQTELNVLHAPPTPPALVLGTQQAEMSLQYARNSCPDCMVLKFKQEFMKRTLLKLLEGGTDTGVAVQEVRAVFINAAGTNQPVLAAVQTTYLYIQEKLKA